MNLPVLFSTDDCLSTRGSIHVEVKCDMEWTLYDFSSSMKNVWTRFNGDEVGQLSIDSFGNPFALLRGVPKTAYLCSIQQCIWLESMFVVFTAHLLFNASLQMAFFVNSY